MERTRLPSFNLAPASSDHQFTITVPAALWPYLVEWYEGRKQPNETPETFVLRLMVDRALNYREGELVQQFEEPIQEALIVEVSEFRAGVNNTKMSLMAAVTGATVEHTEEDPG